MKWDYAILATGKTHFSNVKTNRINNKIAFGTKFKVENKCRLTIYTQISGKNILGYQAFCNPENLNLKNEYKQ